MSRSTSKGVVSGSPLDNRDNGKSPVLDIVQRHSSFCTTTTSERDSLLKRLNWLLERKAGSEYLQFDYSVMRFYGPEYNFIRTICLNLSTLDVSFPDGHGFVNEHSLKTFVSIMKTSVPGILQLDMRLTKKHGHYEFDQKNKQHGQRKNSDDFNFSGTETSVNSPHTNTNINKMRSISDMGNSSSRSGGNDSPAGPMQDGQRVQRNRTNTATPRIGIGADLDDKEWSSRLKEQKWAFHPAEDASFFAKMTQLMLSRGEEISRAFHVLDRLGKGYIDIADVEAAVSEVEDEEVKSLFTPLSIVRMFANADPNNIDRVRFSDFFAFLIFSCGDVPLQPMENYLLIWLQVSEWRHEQQINEIFWEGTQPVGPTNSTRKARSGSIFESTSTEYASQPMRRGSKAIEKWAETASTCTPSGPSKILPHLHRKSTALAVALALKEVEEGDDDFEEEEGEDTHRDKSKTKQIAAYVSRFSARVHDESAVEALKDKKSADTTAADTAAALQGNPAQEDVDFYRKRTLGHLRASHLKEVKEAKKRANTLRAASLVRVIHAQKDHRMPNLMQGELVTNKCDNCTFVLCTSKNVSEIQGEHAGDFKRSGCVYLTNFRLCFVADEVLNSGENDAPILTNSMQIPLKSIARVDLAHPDTSYHISVVAKDHRCIYFRFPFEKDEAFAALFISVMESYCFSNSPEMLYAFAARKERAKAPLNPDSSLMIAHQVYDGWSVFNPEEEYRRQGLLPDIGDVHARQPSVVIEADHGVIPVFSASTTSFGSTHASPVSGHTSNWRLWSDDYTLSPTYPSAFIVPSKLSNEEIVEAANFRSRQRIPAVTWGSPNGAVLARSSQPNAGIADKRSLADKLLLNLLRTKGKLHSDEEEKHPSQLYILDCRSRLAANANKALGKGVENEKKLVRTYVSFCGIANIHTMRDSFSSLGKLTSPGLPRFHDMMQMPSKLMGAIRTGLGWVGLAETKKKHDIVYESERGEYESSEATSTSTRLSVLDQTNQEIGRDADEAKHVSNVEYGVRLHETGWLDHIRLVMSSSIEAAEKLHKEQSSVLVHCSDGWDRTAQVCATAQLILDPFFRTLRGFMVLIEKDWTGFGHKFQDRLGHGVNHGKANEATNEVSPVFLQWLDVVWQLTMQFPQQFEFNSTLLMFISDSIFSGISGTFLGNSQKQRLHDMQCDIKTFSIWTFVMSDKDSFINRKYKAHEGPIWPNARHVRLWEHYYCRYLPEYHPRVFSERWPSYIYLMGKGYDYDNNGRIRGANQTHASELRESYADEHNTAGGRVFPDRLSTVSYDDIFMDSHVEHDVSHMSLTRSREEEKSGLKSNHSNKVIIPDLEYVEVKPNEPPAKVKPNIESELFGNIV